MGVPGKSLRSRQVPSEILCVPQISPSNTINTCHEEGKELGKTVEERQPGQDSPAGVEWRRAVHVIELSSVIFF